MVNQMLTVHGFSIDDPAFWSARELWLCPADPLIEPMWTNRTTLRRIFGPYLSTIARLTSQFPHPGVEYLHATGAKLVMFFCHAIGYQCTVRYKSPAEPYCIASACPALFGLIVLCK